MKKNVVSLTAAAFVSLGASAAAQASELHTVKQGDTLFSIANHYKITVVQLMEMNQLTSDKLFIQDQLIVSKEGSVKQSEERPEKENEAIVSAAASSYQVKSGDSLGAIASRYKTSVEALMKLNDLRSTTIYAGQTLKVNGKAAPAEQVKKESKAPAAVSNSTYTVKSGDSLGAIASRHKTSVTALKQLNQLTSDVIYAGQTLKVSGKAAPAEQVKKETKAPAAVSSNTYTVKSGDSLGAIASRHKTSVAALKQLNQLTSDVIYAGQTLKVSGKAATVTEPAKTETKAPAVASNGFYTVKSGDSLGLIASAHDMTVAALKQMNGLKSNIIFAGQKLKVAAGASGTKPPAEPGRVNNLDSSGSYAVSALLSTANSLVGIPYVWGGSSPSGFDCSGFIYYAYKQAGKNVSRTNTEGYFNRSYEVSNPVPGDLVFFSNTYKKGISHMGIYIGGNQFVHASSSTGVAVTSLDNVYFKSKFTSFKRLY